MPPLDSPGQTPATSKMAIAKKKRFRRRVTRVVAFVAAAAVFVGNIDKITSTVTGWFNGKKSDPPTIVLQITSESLLQAAHQLTAVSEHVVGDEKHEAEQSVQNLNAAAGVLQSPISLTDAAQTSPPWLLKAMGEMGQKEISGEMHNPRILEYIRSVSPNNSSAGDELPWQSYFVNWVFIKSGLEGSNSGVARSWMNWGVPLDHPRPGAVAVFSRGENPRLGQVGFYLGDAGDYVLYIGGNVGNAVNIDSAPKSKVVGYRWPVTR